MNNLNIALIIIIIILSLYHFNKIELLGIIVVGTIIYLLDMDKKSIITGGNDNYPFKKTIYPPDSAGKMMEKLKLVKPNISDKKCFPYGVHFKTTTHKDGSLTLSSECKVTFIHEDADYENFDVIGDLFTEYARLSARLVYQKKSPLEEWADPEYRKKFKGSPAEIRELLYKTTPEATQFKPSLMVQIVKYLFADTNIRILDPSAGWGDRMLAAIALGASKYTAFDPNKSLKKGHDEIIEYFGVVDKFSVTYEPFEKAELTGEYDLVFTSPPYFDLEIYTDMTGQSIKEYSDFKVWMRDFLYVMLEKSWKVLRKDGYMVIHMSDLFKKNICEPMCLYAMSHLPDIEFIGCFCSVGKAGKPRPLWVFKKSGKS